MSEQFEPINPESALSREANTYLILSERMHRACDLLAAAQRSLGIQDDEDREMWLESGAEYEVLEPGASSWVKGRLRVRLSLEFCPDEPEAG